MSSENGRPARRPSTDPAFSDHFVRPLYGSYCFSELPRLITSLFAGARDDEGTAERLLGQLAGSYNKVVLCFVDAFGRRFLEQFGDRYPFLRRIMAEGVATNITSQFPSTTAAHVTTIHTGYPVGESGVYEWFYYDPVVDAMIAPLLFSYAGDRERGTLVGDADPATLFPTKTLYQTLGRLGVLSHVLLHADLANTPYGSVVLNGAQVLPYATFPEALRTLTDLLTGMEDRLYANLYVSSIDTAGHRYGPGSEQFAAAIDLCFTALEQLLHAGLQGQVNNTLFLLVADHGQMAVDPATTIYLNRRFPKILPWMMTNRRGQLLAPAGACRDFFLHIRDEHLDEAHSYLHEQLAGHSAVYLTRDLIADGFFGADPPSPALLDRVGNLVVLPYAHQSVFWYEPGRFEQRHRGAHGGLSPEEMETVLLALPYH